MTAVAAGRQLVVMARWPAPGRCKRRLAAGVGHAAAAAIQARLGDHTLAVATRASAGLGAELVLASSDLGRRASRRWAVGGGCDRAVIQGRGGLGLRLQRQVVRAFREGARQLVIIGSDLPQLEVADLLAAFAALEEAPLVLGPADDGGYWLLGLRRPCAVLFCGLAWGGSAVLAQTQARAAAAGLAWRLLRRQADLDRPQDLRRWA